MPEQKEVELAFTIIDSPESILSHPRLALLDSTKSIQNLITSYFDTSEHTLFKSGWSVSVRKNGDNYIQRIKGPNNLASRIEIEMPIENDNLNLEALQQSPIWSFISDSPEHLKPLFKTEINRTSYNLNFASASVEASVDVGHIVSLIDNTELAIQDLELEKKSGSNDPLYKIAIEFVSDTDIMMQATSKAARGYQLINKNKASAYKAVDLELTKNISLTELICAVFTNSLNHLRQNLHAAYNDDIEGVHQLRVAIRRTRAALNFFRPVLQPEIVRIFDLQLRHYGQVFGKARDWDVFINETLGKASEVFPDNTWLEIVKLTAVLKQGRAHKLVHNELEGTTFNNLILSMMGWISSDKLLLAGAKYGDTRAANVVPELLHPIAKKVNAKSRKLKKIDNLHALRKAVKRLRYAIEFSNSVYDYHDNKQCLKVCKKLQIVLGEINDVSVTNGLGEELSSDTPIVAPGFGTLETWLKDRHVKAEESLPSLVKELKNSISEWL